MPLYFFGSGEGSTELSVLVEEIDACETAVITSCSGGSTKDSVHVVFPLEETTNDSVYIVLPVEESTVVGVTVG